MAPAQRGRDRLRALSHADCSVLRTRKPLLELLLSRRYLGLGGLAHKTPSAPYFIYATFEQTDNILTADGQPVEDLDGNVLHPSTKPATYPQECLVDPQPPPGPVDEIASSGGSVILTSNPKTCAPLPVDRYCDYPGSRLYYHNAQGVQPVPSGGN